LTALFFGNLSLTLIGISPKSSENKPKKLVESSRQSSPKVPLKTSALVFSLSLLLAR
jgi:hypothetical protein